MSHIVVTAIETLRTERHPDFIWVRVETSDGVTGLGETMPSPDAVEVTIHRRLAPLLLGRQLSPERFWTDAFQAISYHGYAGAEMRALSAVDIALWDAQSRQLGIPLHRALGGPVRDRVKVYNTCVGYGQIDDHHRFLTDPGSLASELVEEGYAGIKIWPFDAYSVTSGGQDIDLEDLRRGVGLVEAIRDAVGDRIEIMIEGHSCWSLPAATRIARALEPYSPRWFEDPMHARNPGAWRQLRDSTTVPICGSERSFTRFDTLPYLNVGAIDYLNQDVAWTGGISEFRKVAAMAEAFELPVVPHNCHGPVAAAATMAVSAAVPNVTWTETVRSFSRGIHDVVAHGAPTIAAGHVAISDAPGLGIDLREDFLADVSTVRTILDDVRGAHGWGTGDPWDVES